MEVEYANGCAKGRREEKYSTHVLMQLLTACPELIAFGEDLGNIGDVNQGFAGLQEKYGEVRITDVGIREASILGQGIGAAMRGLRPICRNTIFGLFVVCHYKP